MDATCPTPSMPDVYLAMMYIFIATVAKIYLSPGMKRVASIMTLHASNGFMQNLTTSWIGPMPHVVVQNLTTSVFTTLLLYQSTWLMCVRAVFNDRNVQMVMTAVYLVLLGIAADWSNLDYLDGLLERHMNEAQKISWEYGLTIGLIPAVQFCFTYFVKTGAKMYKSPWMPKMNELQASVVNGFLVTFLVFMSKYLAIYRDVDAPYDFLVISAQILIRMAGSQFRVSHATKFFGGQKAGDWFYVQSDYDHILSKETEEAKRRNELKPEPDPKNRWYKVTGKKIIEELLNHGRDCTPRTPTIFTKVLENLVYSNWLCGGLVGGLVGGNAANFLLDGNWWFGGLVGGLIGVLICGLVGGNEKKTDVPPKLYPMSYYKEITNGVTTYFRAKGVPKMSNAAFRNMKIEDETYKDRKDIRDNHDISLMDKVGDEGYFLVMGNFGTGNNLALLMAELPNLFYQGCGTENIALSTLLINILLPWITESANICIQYKKVGRLLFHYIAIVSLGLYVYTDYTEDIVQNIPHFPTDPVTPAPVPQSTVHNVTDMLSVVMLGVSLIPLASLIP